jgi:hypothetical protein
MRDELTNPGVPAGGPCQVEILLTFEAGTDTRLQELGDALNAVYGDSIVNDPSGANIGGQLVRFAWRVRP